MPVLRPFYKFLFAFGAGNCNFPLSLGYPDGLTATGTFKISMVPVLQPVYQHEKFPVLPIPLVGVSGKGAENGNAHQHIGQHMQQQVRQGRRDKNRHHHDSHAGPQKGGIELIVTVAPSHELVEPISELVH